MKHLLAKTRYTQNIVSIKWVEQQMITNHNNNNSFRPNEGIKEANEEFRCHCTELLHMKLQVVDNVVAL